MDRSFKTPKWQKLEQRNNGVHGIFWNVLMFWQDVNLELLKLLKVQS